MEIMGVYNGYKRPCSIIGIHVGDPVQRFDYIICFVSIGFLFVYGDSRVKIGSG